MTRTVLRTLLALVKVVLLVGIIWFLGPLLTVLGITPLASELSRLVTIGVGAALWVVVVLVRAASARRRRQLVTRGLTPLSEQAATAPRRLAITRYYHRGG